MRDSRRWWLLLAVLAAGIGTALLLGPFGTSETCTATPAGELACRRDSMSLLQAQGLGVVGPLAVPAGACLLAAYLPSALGTRFVAVGLLAFCLLTGLSIGLFFLPVAAGALVLAFWSKGPLALPG